MSPLEFAKLLNSADFSSRPKLAVTVLLCLVDYYDEGVTSVTNRTLFGKIAELLSVKEISISSNIGKVVSDLANQKLVVIDIYDENGDLKPIYGRGTHNVIRITKHALEIFGRK